MNVQKEELQMKLYEVLGNLNETEGLILKDILQAEKNLLHRKTLQGTNITNSIVDIIKERVK